tara:strand:- start:195 stop:581 length:387 start_codon:yes stop_codon:yes gene_type:complete
MTSYQEYKNYHYLFKIENYLEKILSKPIKDIIFNYKGNENYIMFLENNQVKCRMQLKEKVLQLDMFDKKLNKWSNGNVYFAFNFTTSNNVGIGTTFPNVGITIQPNGLLPQIGIRTQQSINIPGNLPA